MAILTLNTDKKETGTKNEYTLNMKRGESVRVLVDGKFIQFVFVE